MTQTHEIPDDVFAQTVRPEHRASPYALFRRLREEPVSHQKDDIWVVSGYDEVQALLADPRMSSDYQRVTAQDVAQQESLPFIFTDPPHHDWVRRHVMRHFGPPGQPGKIISLEDQVLQIATDELDHLRGRTRMDVVADYAYNLPVALICHLMGVPVEDEHLFRTWVGPLVTTFGNPDATPAQLEGSQGALAGMGGYLTDLVGRRQAQRRDDLISDLCHDESGDGRLSDQQIAQNAGLIFIAGHVTTVNATANTMLLLLRNPDVLQQVREDPELLAPTFEEALRMTGPIHYVLRVALDDIPIGGKVIPRDADVRLHLAAADRDPRRFVDPDTFDPHRPDNQHLAFNGGPHVCFGAALARMEARIMLTEWLRRVRNPRLVTDPPPYGDSPVVVGPSELFIDYDGIDD